jgi:hypothetical protein
MKIFETPPQPHDYRCSRCGRLLFRARLPRSGWRVEIRCRQSNCGKMNVFPREEIVMAEITEADKLELTTA